MTLKVAGSLAMVGVRVLQDSNFDRKVSIELWFWWPSILNSEAIFN
jgi:hypothetical protein